MKYIHDWDLELDKLTQEVSSLAADQLKSKATRNKGLVARKMATIQSQLKIEKMFRRIRSFCEREFLLLPKEKALLHWSGIFLEKIEKYYELKQRNLTRSLWLKLIRTRIAGPGQSPFAAFDQDDIISLSLRHAALLKSEKYLADALIRKEEEKQEAIERYRQLTVAQENRISAASMQGRLGTDLDHALTNPLVNHLGRAMIELAASLHNPQQSALLADLGLKYDRGTKSLLELCEKTALHRKADPTWMPTAKMMDRVQKTFKKLDKLEDASRASFNELMTPEIATSRPKIVQSSSKKDKTISPEPASS